MAFVRYKVVDGKKYYQFVRNYREGGKHRQEVIYHLGGFPSVPDAIAAKMRTKRELESAAYECQRLAAENTKKIHSHPLFDDMLDGKIPPPKDENTMRHARLDERNDLRWSWRDQEEEQRFASLNKEFELLNLILAYHDLREDAADYEHQAILLQAEIEKLLQIEAKYL
jgi:hypothetical protein